jgi:hypothetical protein
MPILYLEHSRIIGILHANHGGGKGQILISCALQEVLAYDSSALKLLKKNVDKKYND